MNRAQQSRTADTRYLRNASAAALQYYCVLPHIPVSRTQRAVLLTPLYLNINSKYTSRTSEGGMIVVGATAAQPSLLALFVPAFGGGAAPLVGAAEGAT